VCVAGDFGLERRAFLRNCVASWLLVCTAAMAETAGAQPSATSTCLCLSWSVLVKLSKLWEELWL